MERKGRFDIAKKVFRDLTPFSYITAYSNTGDPLCRWVPEEVKGGWKRASFGIKSSLLVCSVEFSAMAGIIGGLQEGRGVVVAFSAGSYFALRFMNALARNDFGDFSKEELDKKPKKQLVDEGEIVYMVLKDKDVDVDPKNIEEWLRRFSDQDF